MAVESHEERIESLSRSLGNSRPRPLLNLTKRELKATVVPEVLEIFDENLTKRELKGEDSDRFVTTGTSYESHEERIESTAKGS